MVSGTALKKFKKIYLAEYGVELEEKELIEKANRLLNLYRVIYQDILNIKINKNHAKKISHTQHSK